MPGNTHAEGLGVGLGVHAPARGESPVHAHSPSGAVSGGQTLDKTRALKLARLGRVAKEVFELLVEAQGPVKAYDLLWRLQTKRGSASPPSTIYRALNSLIRAGLTHKVESLSAHVLCATPSCEHVAALLICERCNSVIELNGDAAAKAVKARVRRHGFEPRRLSLEFWGLCEACSSPEESKGERHEETPPSRR